MPSSQGDLSPIPWADQDDGKPFYLCARQDGAVIQARVFASMPERNDFYRWKCCANPLDCRVVRLSDHVPEGRPLPDTELTEKLMQLCMQETEDV